MEKIIVKEQNLYYVNDDRSYRIRGFEDIILSHLWVIVCGDNSFIDIVDPYSQKSRNLFINKLSNHLKLNRGFKSNSSAK